MGKNRDSRIEVLKLVLADVEKERDRLRGARASFTPLLGPLPASAAVVAGVIATAAGKFDWWWAAGAGVVFVGLLTVSVLFSGLKPYREFRADHETNEFISFRAGETDLKQWLEAKVRAEEEIYGRAGEQRHRLWPTPCPHSLTEALNSERAAAYIVQWLSFVIYAILIVGLALGS